MAEVCYKGKYSVCDTGAAVLCGGAAGDIRSGQNDVVDKPHEGAWKIVVRRRDQVSHPVTYGVYEALVVPTSNTNKKNGLLMAMTAVDNDAP